MLLKIIYGIHNYIILFIHKKSINKDTIDWTIIILLLFSLLLAAAAGGYCLHNQGEKLYAYDITINIQRYNFSLSVTQHSIVIWLAWYFFDTSVLLIKTDEMRVLLARRRFRYIINMQMIKRTGKGYFYKLK